MTLCLRPKRSQAPSPDLAEVRSDPVILKVNAARKIDD
jgi:hypothetical protein